tara:strand:- start:1145 stop:1453 length:309 start_codon:yes stop_codon:yes gene_type:complete
MLTTVAVQTERLSIFALLLFVKKQILGLLASVTVAGILRETQILEPLKEFPKRWLVNVGFLQPCFCLRVVQEMLLLHKTLLGLFVQYIKDTPVVLASFVNNV